MATYYVTKSGNDTTGNGSVGTPWLTVAKGQASASANDTIMIGPGVYDENVAAGYMIWNKGGLTYKAIDPNDKPVIRGMSLTTYAHIVQKDNLRWDDIIFSANPAINAGAGPTYLFRLNMIGVNGDNMIWNRCEFTPQTCTNVTRLFWANYSPSAPPSGWTFTDCKWDHASTPVSASSNFIVEVTGGVNGITLTRPYSKGFGFRCDNINSGLLTDGYFTTQYGVAINIGRDTDTGNTATLQINGIICDCSGGGTHGLLLGAGATNCLIERAWCRNVGDYGIVIKSCSSNIVRSSVFETGPAAGRAALYFKGSTGNIVENCVMQALANNRVCVYAAANDSAVVPANNIIRNNTFVATYGATVWNWPTANVGNQTNIDGNVYHLVNGNFGIVLDDTTIGSLAELQTAFGTTNGNAERNATLLETRSIHPKFRMLG